MILKKKDMTCFKKRKKKKKEKICLELKLET